MLVRISTQSSATPETGDFVVELKDGELNIKLDTIDDLWKLRTICGRDIAIVADGLRIIDDYWD